MNNSGKPNPMLGRSQTEESKAKMQQNRKLQTRVSGPDGTVYRSMAEAQRSTGVNVKNVLQYKNENKGWKKQ